MLSQPYIPRPYELGFASLSIGVPVKEIIKAIPDRTIFVSRAQLQSLLGSATRMQYYFDFNSTSSALFMHSDKILIPDRNFEDKKMYIIYNSPALACAYLLTKNKSDIIVNIGYRKICQRLDYHLKQIDQLEYHNRQILQEQDQITRIMSNSIDLSTLDLNADKKTLKSLKRKYNVSGEIEGNRYKLTFKDLEVGNEAEGVIQYKKLEIYLDIESYRSKRIIYTFADGFVFDTNWDIAFPVVLHPHISSTNVCYGNNSTAIDTYSDKSNLDMFLDVFIETVRGYNPGGGGENPYASVTAIRTQLSRISELFKGFADVDSKQKIASIINERIGGSDRRNRYPRGAISRFAESECPNCENPLTLSDGYYYCNNPECISSRDHFINCPSCGNGMERIWIRESLEFRHYCSNIECNTGPTRMNNYGDPLCPDCHSEMHYDEDEDAYICSDHDIIIETDYTIRDQSEIETAIVRSSGHLIFRR